MAAAWIAWTRVGLAFLLLGLGAAQAAPRTILVLGDSLSAGFGVDLERGWVALLDSRLRARHPGWRVVNASISGDTTASALARLPRALEVHQPDLVIVELGGNDGLQGLSLAEMRRNLAAIIKTVRQRGIKILLVGMRLPPNYGPAYTQRFHQIFSDLAGRHDVPLVPFFLEGVADRPQLMQEDGIHPRARAQPRMLENLWPHLVPML
ncbi:MAG: arylesterase [Gammaproteobacteria bacterium]|nr:arylesterase [Gammaproteobacteria bacterium]NIR98207.1 arylesterase [Gammaproteobacteria bacterium]NIT63878.1 arylesterase [Gammaproteobacteria bacterium]NIV20882.1 arylesterase [Gammaproteobacteria bacterium]NIY32458.1 arylesterase [Gammaproteobacteria bacterium]